jgi:DNA-binding transcriptional LysR family regulator
MMNNIDLRLLSVIRELQRTGSVSHAAENLGLSQSAVSMTLARLRKHFGDPLFVRTSAGMAPTPYASELIGDLNKAAEILEAALERRAIFDPATSERLFHLCSSDISQFTVLPQLVRKTAQLAPSVRIDLRVITEQTPRLLESGEADLAIGLISPMGAGFCQQKLYASQFVCAIRADHPRIRATLSLPQFEAESHISVTTMATGYQLLERALETQRVQRRIGMRVPSYLGLAAIIEATDYLAIVPSGLGSILCEGRNMKLLPLPFALPSYDVTQNWHERYSLDPGLQWLRGVLHGLFQKPNRPAVKLTKTGAKI